MMHVPPLIEEKTEPPTISGCHVQAHESKENQYFFSGHVCKAMHETCSIMDMISRFVSPDMLKMYVLCCYCTSLTFFSELDAIMGGAQCFLENLGGGNNIMKRLMDTSYTPTQLLHSIGAHRYRDPNKYIRYSSRCKTSFIKKTPLLESEAIALLHPDHAKAMRQVLTQLPKPMLYFKIANTDWITVLCSLQKFDSLLSLKSQYSTDNQLTRISEYLSQFGASFQNKTGNTKTVVNYLVFPALMELSRGTDALPFPTTTQAAQRCGTILMVNETWLDIYTSFSFTLLSGKTGSLVHPLLIRQFLYPHVKINQNANTPQPPVLPPLLMPPRSTIGIPYTIPIVPQLPRGGPSGIAQYYRAPQVSTPYLYGGVPLVVPTQNPINVAPLPIQSRTAPFMPPVTLTPPRSITSDEIQGRCIKQWMVIYWITTILNKQHHSFIWFMLDNGNIHATHSHYEFLFGYLSLFDLSFKQIFQIFLTWIHTHTENVSEPLSDNIVSKQPEPIDELAASFAPFSNTKRKFASISYASDVPEVQATKKRRLGYNEHKNAQSTPEPSSPNRHTVISTILSLIYVKAEHVITVECLDLLYELFYPRLRAVRVVVGSDGTPGLVQVDQSKDAERVANAHKLQGSYEKLSYLVKYLVGIKAAATEAFTYFSLNDNKKVTTECIKIMKMDDTVAGILKASHTKRSQVPIYVSPNTIEEYEYDQSNEIIIDESSSSSNQDHGVILFGPTFVPDKSKHKKAFAPSTLVVDDRHPVTELQDIASWVLDQYEGVGRGYIGNDCVVTMDPSEMVLLLYSLCNDSSPLPKQTKAKILAGISITPKKEYIMEPKHAILRSSIKRGTRHSFKSIVEHYAHLAKNNQLSKMRRPAVPIDANSKHILHDHNVHVWVAAIELVGLYVPSDLESTKPDGGPSTTNSEAARDNVMDNIAKLPFMNIKKAPEIYQSYFDFVIPCIQAQQSLGYGSYPVNAKEVISTKYTTQRVKSATKMPPGETSNKTPTPTFYKTSDLVVDPTRVLWDEDTLMIYNVIPVFLRTKDNLPQGDSELTTGSIYDILGPDVVSTFDKNTLQSHAETVYLAFMNQIYCHWVALLLKNKT